MWIWHLHFGIYNLYFHWTLQCVKLLAERELMTRERRGHLIQVFPISSSGGPLRVNRADSQLQLSVNSRPPLTLVPWHVSRDPANHSYPSLSGSKTQSHSLCLKSQPKRAWNYIKPVFVTKTTGGWNGGSSCTHNHLAMNWLIALASFLKVSSSLKQCLSWTG